VTEDIPKTPLNLRLYYWLRSTLFPIQTARYLSAESIIVGILSIIIMISLNITDLIIYTVVVLFFILLSTSYYLSTPPDRRDYPTHVLDISYFAYLIMGVFFSLILTGYILWSNIKPINYISLILGVVYLISIMSRSRKYKGNRDYFTDSFSSANRDWERASVALEMAIHNKEENVKSSFYWAKKAERIYEDIIEYEDRVAYRDAANSFSVACGFVSASIFTKSKRSYSFWKAAEQSIDEAMEFLSYRVCDNCGRKNPINNCKAIIDDGHRIVICQRCIRQDANHQKQNRRDNSKKRNNNQQTERQKYSRRNDEESTSNTKKERQRYHQNRSQNNKRNRTKKTNNTTNMNIDDALDALQLDEVPDNTSKIHAAFRERVKEVHPDIGGSTEEFKEVKKAREFLVDQI
jgi:hypothetical protein